MTRTFAWIGLLGILTAAGSAGAQPAQPPTTRPNVDPLADQIFKESSAFLAKVPAFSVHAEVWKDVVLSSGHKIQVTRTLDLTLRRPDRLQVDARAPHRRGRSIWYDGKTLTVYDREANVYGVVDAPPKIDDMLDEAADQYGVTVPLEDLAVSDPYASAMKHVNEGGYFGEEPVLGVPCRHLGFSTERIDWQVWIATGPQPLPQKLVITYKDEPECPQYTAIFTKWSLTGRASDLAFQFIPPPGSAQTKFLPEKHEGGAAHNAERGEEHNKAREKTGENRP